MPCTRTCLRTACLFLALAAAAGAQVGTPENVLFPFGTNLFPQAQTLQVSPDKDYVAVTGSSSGADVVITRVDARGGFDGVVSIAFPAGNDVSSTNSGLAMSRRGSFLCCYGSNPSVGDLVFMARNAQGSWFSQNVAFPSANNVPLVGTRPVISPDEDFIVCRGLDFEDLVIVPVDYSQGFPQAGLPFGVSLPEGNNLPAQGVNPVVAPDGRSFAVPGTSLTGDLVVVRVGRPVTGSNVLAFNLDYPGGNDIPDVTVPVVAGPRSNYYATMGFGSAGDLVVIPVDGNGTPGTPVNVLLPAGNNVPDVGVPPSVSGDGRLLAVNGSLAAGDLALLPVDGSGQPGTPVNVAFPQSNFWPNGSLPPVVSHDARLVLQRGADTTGDLVAVQVSFTDPLTVTWTATNVLYPSSNNIPGMEAHIALAPDRSFCVTTGASTTGDLVMTPFDDQAAPQAPENILYPSGNNLPSQGVTPLLAGDGMTAVTRGFDTIGDLVVTEMEVDTSSGLVTTQGSTNVLFPASNNLVLTGSRPVASPTGQTVVSTGHPTTGDLVLVPLERPAPYLLGPGDPGTSVSVRIHAPGDANLPYILGASEGRFPGLPLPDGRTIPLLGGSLLAFSLSPANGVFFDMTGVLDAVGMAEARIDLPALPAGQGLWFYLAFATLDPAASSGVATVSEATTFVIR